MYLSYGSRSVTISLLVSIIGLSLVALNTPAWSDEIKNLERKVEYLKQKKELDAQLQNIQTKLQKLKNKYSDVLNISSENNTQSLKNLKPKKRAALTSTPIYEFSEIMELMQNKNIKLEFSQGYRPFKVKKDGEKWVFEQQVNFERSEIVDGGNNKISATDFPPTWPINGTWKFRKDGNKCRIDHTLNVGNMTWDC